MIYNLTENEKAFARWLVEKIGSGEIAENRDLLILPTANGHIISSMLGMGTGPRLIYSATSGVVKALVDEGLLRHINKSEYAITRRLFEAVKADFGTVVQSATRQAQSGVLLDKENSIQRGDLKHRKLTKKQKELAKWLVEKIRDGEIDELFAVSPAANLTYEIFNKEGDVFAQRGSTRIFQALVSHKLIVHFGNPSEGTDFYFLVPDGLDNAVDLYLVQQALYDAVDTDFGPTPLGIAQPEQNNSLLVRVNRNALVELMTTRFDVGDLKTLCYKLNIDYEELSQDKKTDLVRELLLYMNRRGRLRELIATILEERPNVNWSMIFKD